MKNLMTGLIVLLTASAVHNYYFILYLNQLN